MSVYERRRLIAGILKIELEIAAVTNGYLIIYSPEANAYLAIPQEVFGIESDFEAQMLTEGYIVSPDTVLYAAVDDVEKIFTDGVLVFANTTATGGVLEIPYAIGDGFAATVSGDLLKHLEGIVNSIFDVTSTIGKRRAQTSGGEVTIAEIGSNAVMHTTRYAVGENYVTMSCNAAITNMLQYTITENEAGGLTYDITADAAVYEVEGGAYDIGGSNESE